MPYTVDICPPFCTAFSTTEPWVIDVKSMFVPQLPSFPTPVTAMGLDALFINISMLEFAIATPEIVKDVLFDVFTVKLLMGVTILKLLTSFEKLLSFSTASKAFTAK